ncbi:MAG: polysaccharide biosynthesis/export family protein [Nitrospira sp.]|nr:polysaccharide biosynthesis/export family protein [Nitrospira sp.]
MPRLFRAACRILFGLCIGLVASNQVGCQWYDLRETPAAVQNTDEPGYLLGPEDVLLISVWKDEHLTREVIVRPDGMISFPLAGDMAAEGKTVETLRTDLAKRLGKYIPNVNVTVALTKMLSYKIYVMGRVNKPGEYLVGHYTDVLQALSLAGGLTPFAAENDIKIVRRTFGQQQTFPFRYGEVRKGAGLDQNILLQRGDVVMVP